VKGFSLDSIKFREVSVEHRCLIQQESARQRADGAGE